MNHPPSNTPPSHPNRRFFGLRHLLAGGLLLSCLGIVRAQNYTPYSITTMAGVAGNPGTSDGTGSSAHFNNPNGVAVDGSGNVYVADSRNYTIRKITPGGTVTTLAGLAGSAGSSDGSGGVGGTARFGILGGIAIDSAGAYLYVTDWATGSINGAGTGSVRKINISSGAVSTLVPTSAGLNGPMGIAITASGTLYVADAGNYVIQKITSGGAMSVFAGQVANNIYANGQGTSAAFDYPLGVAVDSSGNVYVADYGSCTIREITPSGLVSNLAGFDALVGSTDGAEGSSSFNHPAGICVDASGNIYLADTNNNTLRRITAGGTVSTLAGLPPYSGSTDGPGNTARFSTPYGIAVDASGNLYVADTTNSTVRKGAVATAIAPSITTPPASQTVTVGTPATFTVGVAGTAPFSYQWLEGGVVAPGTSTGSSYTIANPMLSDSGGSFSVQVTNGAGTVTSAAAVLTVNAASPAPSFTTQPQSQTVAVGATVTLTALATGTPAPAYQWYFNNAAIANATSASYSISSAALTNSGSYAVTAINTAGTATSSAATLTVVTPPTFTVQPQSQTMASGSSVVFNAAATLSATYQWYFNGTAITGATSSLYYLSGATSANAGTYTCVATASGVSTTSTSATLAFTSTSLPGYLANISARAFVGTGLDDLVGGFVIQGSGTKEVLLRGIGPGLNDVFGFPGYLTNPTLTLLDGNNNTLYTNTGWGGAQAIINADTALGAFTLNPAHADSALLVSLPASGVSTYTAQVTGVNNTTGVALDEIYDADSQAPAVKLGNISARAFVGTGLDVLVGGFVIRGNTSATILIRGIGPGLADVFGFPGALTQPILQLFDANNNLIASNTVWGGNATIASVALSIGAFTLNLNHADSVLLVTLPPGNYTAQVSGVNGGTGVALVEIYSVP